MSALRTLDEAPVFLFALFAQIFAQLFADLDGLVL